MCLFAILVAQPLFSGKDLTGWTTWLQDTQRKDPRKVFTVQDGLLRISGDGMGYLATEKEHQDYHLVVEYKWGKEIHVNLKSVRNSGVLLHANGPDGGAGKGAWMSSIECQLAQGCAGDFIVIQGKDQPKISITADIELGPDRRPRWKKGGKPTLYSGRQFWWAQHDPEFKEDLDTRGRWDVEKPVGEWNQIECVCSGPKIRVIVNGTTVNECYDVTPASGKILLQCEGYEILFRKVELRPLNPR